MHWNFGLHPGILFFFVCLHGLFLYHTTPIAQLIPALRCFLLPFALPLCMLSLLFFLQTTNVYRSIHDDFRECSFILCFKLRVCHIIGNNQRRSGQRQETHHSPITKTRQTASTESPNRIGKTHSSRWLLAVKTLGLIVLTWPTLYLYSSQTVGYLGKVRLSGQR